MKSDLHYMNIALKRAKKSAEMGEVPVGAVIVKKEADGSERIISYGQNNREKSKNALLHAEISAINKACKKLGGWRLVGCTMYVTLEPCPMCAGAILNSRIERVVYGACDSKFGALQSVISLFDHPFNHKPEIVGPIMQEECSKILTYFFKKRRLENKKTTC